jgi:shikimate kinase
MLSRPNIFLIGPMGSGKTAVGRRLARSRRVSFYDTDAEIEARTGVPVSRIFEEEGEAAFRRRERAVIEELTRLEPIILSTGGGAILLTENREALRSRGTVVYLETSVAQQVQRVSRGRHRPLLANVDPALRLAELMSIRGPLYLECADLVVRTDTRRVQSVAEEILQRLRQTIRGV